MKKIRAISILMAMVLTASALSGCKAKKNDEGGETITWYVPTLISGDEKEAVFEKVNSILKEKYNIQLDLIGIDGGNYASKLQVMNAGQDVYDLAFTSHWNNNYFSNVANGVFHEITEDELKKYAPKTYESTDSNIWKTVKVDGKIYAVPNWQVQARASAVYVPKDFLATTNTDINSMLNIDDMTEYLRKIHAIDKNCDKIPQLWAQLMPYYEMTEVYEENMPGAIKFTDTGIPKVINQFQTQEFKDYLAIRRSWIKEGLCTGNYYPDSGFAKKEIMQQPFYIHVYKPGGAEEASVSNGYEIESKQISGALLTTSGITAAMTGISQTSEHPEAALKMIEIMNTDSEICNLLSYGFEGSDYEKVSENQIKTIKDKKYNGVRNWHIGSVANTYLLDTQTTDVWENTKKFNEEAINSPLLGFNANLDDITLEAANCKTVVNEYLMLLDLGISDEAKYEEFIQKLKAAGVDELISKIQKQVDEWYDK